MVTLNKGGRTLRIAFTIGHNMWSVWAV